MVSQHVDKMYIVHLNVLQSENPYLMYFDSWSNGKHMKLWVTIVISFSLKNNIVLQMKNNPESGEFCFVFLHICLFNNGKAIHLRTTLRPLRLLF